MAFKIADIYTDLSVKGYSTTSRQLDQFKQHLQRANAEVDKMSKTMNRMFAVGGAGLGAFSFNQMAKFAGNYEAGFTEIKKTTDLTAQEFAKLQDTLDGMSKSMKVPIADLQQIAATAGQLGIQGVGDIAKFTEQVSMLKETSRLGAEEAASMAAVLLNQFKLPIKDIEKLTSTLTKLAATSVASEGDILEVTRRTAGTASTLGMTLDQTMAIAAALKDAGVSSEVGGTVLTNLFSTMIGEADKVADAVGMARDEFKKLASDNPVKLVETLFTRLQNVSPEDRIKLLGDIGEDGGKATATMLQLANAADKIQVHLKTAADEFKNPIALAKEFAAQFDDINKNMTAVSNKLQSFAMDKDKGLGKAINTIVTGASEALDYANGDIEWNGNVPVAASSPKGQQIQRERAKRLAGSTTAKHKGDGINHTRDMIEGVIDLNAEIRKAFGREVGTIDDEIKIQASKDADARIREIVQKAVASAVEQAAQAAPLFDAVEGWFGDAKKQAEEWGAKNKERRGLFQQRQDFAQQVADQFMGQMPQEFKPQFQGIDELHKQIQLAAVAPKKKGIEEIAADMLEQMKEEKMVLEEVKKLIAEGNIILPAV